MTCHMEERSWQMATTFLKGCVYMPPCRQQQSIPPQKHEEGLGDDVSSHPVLAVSMVAAMNPMVRGRSPRGHCDEVSRENCGGFCAFIANWRNRKTSEQHRTKERLVSVSFQQGKGKEDGLRKSRTEIPLYYVIH